MSSNNYPSYLSSVIVVDDEIELTLLFKTFLTKRGYDVISFSDPLLALEYIKNNHDRHSLLITDVKMPGMSGIELVKKIREINSNMKIFLMTAFDIRDFEKNFEIKASKIDILIQKPFRFSVVLEMIKIALET